MIAVPSRSASFLAVCLGALGAFAGCGKPADLAPALLVKRLSNPQEDAAEEAVRELARQGRATPERVIPLLIEELVRQHEAQLALAARVTPDLQGIAEPGARAEVVIDVTRSLRNRLARAGFVVGQARQEGEAIELYVAAPVDRSLIGLVRDRLLEVLRSSGEFQLRAEVPAPFTVSPERPVSPWPGDLAAYTAWREGEVALWRATQGDPAAYRPTRSDMALVPVVRGPETEGLEAVPLLVPAGDAPQATDLDLHVSVADDPFSGTPALYLTALPGHEAHVRAALTAVGGLTLWLVADGRAVLPTRLPGAPGVAVTFPVGGSDLVKARTRALELAQVLGVGRPPRPVKVELLNRPTPIKFDDPVCRALVRSGPAAEPALDALVARDPSFAALVEKLREGILQTRTE
jgi:hypothetical protein